MVCALPKRLPSPAPMPTPRKYHGVHKQQLFHWLAASSHRSAGMKGSLTDVMRREYLDALRGSLERGLWVKSPRHPEELALADFRQPLSKAIACFTEWSLDESQPHSGEYGRMAFGFSKSWLIARGGQPITYFDHSRRSGFLKALVSLLKRCAGDMEAFDAALYLAHFTKRMQRPTTRPTLKDGPKRKRITPPPPSKSRSKPVPDPYARFWSKTMPYLEEREWRVVEHPRLVENGVLVPNRTSETPKYFLPYKPGTELFTLLLPDNRMVSEVLRTTWFARRLFPAHAPHVTVLSLQDIGTF
jgi:hypothetical protein